MSAVRLEHEPRGIARLTLARPDVKNAFDAQLIADLTRAVGEIDRDARAVILASEGDAFCAGADVAWMRSMADRSRDENAADSRAGAGPMRIASSASRTNGRPASASLYMATVRRRIRFAVRKMRRAISPRFATRSVVTSAACAFRGTREGPPVPRRSPECQRCATP